MPGPANAKAATKRVGAEAGRGGGGALYLKTLKGEKMGFFL